MKQDELKLKDYQIHQAKLQNDIDIEQKIRQAIEYNEQILRAQYKQRETESELQHRRIKDESLCLLNQVEKLQKTLDNVPPE